MAESPNCPTVKCADRGKPMPRAPLRRHDINRKITRYACPTCRQEILKRAA
jgi:mRNA-degrading endonuclease toxin of MazEF toxin-antitoxin module